MGLRAKVALLLLLAFGVTLGGAIAVNSLVVLPQLREAEARADELSLRRIKLGLDTVHRALGALAYDYAVWDDTFAFFSDHDPAYLARNYTDDSLDNARAHGVALFAADGTPVFRREIDSTTGRAVDGPQLSLAELRGALTAALPPDGDPPLRLTGLRSGAGHPFLFGATSVKQTNQRGDSPGWVVFYRFLDESLKQQISESMQIDFDVEPATSADADTRYRDADNRLHWTLHADDGMPLYRASVKMPPSMVDSSLLPTAVRVAIGLAVAVFALILWHLEVQVLRPVTRMARHLQQVRRDSNYALRLQAQGNDELAVLGRECDSLISYVEHQHGRLSDLSNRDALSGVANRRQFDERLADFVSLARRRALPLALLMCDLDAFKAYNDALGHPAGDEVLRQFGALLATGIARDSDVPCRYGGEEFAVLLPDTDAEGATLVAARLHERLAELALPHPSNPADALVTVSIGIAVLNPAAAESVDPAMLVAQADKALYEAKRAGRNRTVIYRST